MMHLRSQAHITSNPLEEPNRSLDSDLESPEKPSKIARTENSGDVEQSDNSQIMSQNPRIQRYLIAVEYIGTRFSGSQQQLNCRTVVGVLEEAFQKFVGKPVSIFCSSRTDAGVHALSNVCHVDVQRVSKRKPGEVLPPHEPAVVRRAVNHFLQKSEGDLLVIDVRCVPADFHARYKALERTYFYRMLSGPEPLSIFDRDRAWHVPEDLDLAAMQKACKILVGCHDFSSFRAAGCQANSPIRTLDELHASEVVSTPYFPSSVERGQANFAEKDPLVCINASDDKPTGKGSIPNHENVQGPSNGGGLEFGQRRRHRCYVVTARSRSFLYHQVRLLVGVLKCVGTGVITVDDVERILNAKTVTAASPMAPACGLYLGNVKYDLP
ncbi:tRNA pseudouridine synthase A [Telopea speciosissima]|uniref:tRNA pseudouridine synthase A n=1 Tax=Telopea speciosissima TaxID=54955 RepID=UPI001CC818B3|nr:tRNA pseudouridine synthase A [Telopea speciosissima]